MNDVLSIIPNILGTVEVVIVIVTGMFVQFVATQVMRKQILALNVIQI